MPTLSDLTVYETRARLYVVGADAERGRYRVLKVDRTAAAAAAVTAKLATDDGQWYGPAELRQLLAMIHDGNLYGGYGLRLVAEGVHGIVGFVRFLDAHYLYVVTKSSVVAHIGGHAIRRVDETRLLPLGYAPGSSSGGSNSGGSGNTGNASTATATPPPTKDPLEQKYVDTFMSVLNKDFYFSHTYDITRTLQCNMLHGSVATDENAAEGGDDNRRANVPTFEEMFVWNHYLLETGFGCVDKRSPWTMPLIHGFIEQATLSVTGRAVIVTLIARRSRHFAGARFLKRGVNDQGHVANEVESEQIVRDASAGSTLDGTHFTSFVQHRGSIPLSWSQETASMAPKPPIQLNISDPYYSDAALHFDHMLRRYAAPIIALNLVKHKEAVRRESILLEEYSTAIKYLNQFLPEEKRMKYVAFDMGRAAKSPDHDVIGILEEIASECLSSTHFFHSAPEPYANALRRPERTHRRRPLIQHGIIRTNCVDCLDRTNAAQFIVGKCAFVHQLHALGLIAEPRLSFDCGAIKTLMEMYHDHGDIIALQYGGSALVNTMETYRKTSAWSSQSRDMIETVKRYYSNSFTDAEKQDAINLFLGNFIPAKDRPTLWELDTDFYLHNEDPRIKRGHRHYTSWFNPNHLEVDIGRKGAQAADQAQEAEEKPSDTHLALDSLTFEDLYRVHEYTSFDTSFPMHMDHSDIKDMQESPFVETTMDLSSSRSLVSTSGSVASILPNPTIAAVPPAITSRASPLKSSLQQTTEVLSKDLLEPRVSDAEAAEYERYVNQFGEAFLRDCFSTNTDAHDKQFYTAYIRESQTIRLGSQAYAAVKPQDLAIYEKAVQTGRNMAFISARAAAAAVRNSGYRRWLETGKYGLAG